MKKELASAIYPEQVTEENATEAFFALQREMEISRFCKRTGLPREEVTVVVNATTGKGFPQWLYAVPQQMRVIVRGAEKARATGRCIVMIEGGEWACLSCDHRFDYDALDNPDQQTPKFCPNCGQRNGLKS